MTEDIQVSPGTPTAEVANEVADGFATLVYRFCAEQVALRARLAGRHGGGDADGGVHRKHS